MGSAGDRATDRAGDRPAAAGGGFGLLGMRERVQLLGGRLEIDGRPGTGAVLTVTLPPPSTSDAGRVGAAPGAGQLAGAARGAPA